MGEQEAVDLGDMDPLEQVRVVGPVRSAVGCHAFDPAVDAADPVHCTLRVGGGAEGGHGQEGAGALQASPRIAAIVGVFSDSSHRQWVQGLQQQCTQAADEHRCVGVHPADRPVHREPARSRGVVDPVAVLRTLRAGDHCEQPLPEAFSDRTEVGGAHHSPTLRVARSRCRTPRGFVTVSP